MHKTDDTNLSIVHIYLIWCRKKGGNSPGDDRN